jgi:hypothetical protein
MCGLLLALLLPTTGATCNPFRRGGETLAPAAFVAPPTLDDIIYAVNANTSRIQSLQSDSVSLSAQGYPSLRATIAMQAPRCFRLRANFLGPELDVGSNNEDFWFWAKSNPEPVVYYARHDQLEDGSLRRLIPMEPSWLMEAFGLVYLEPGGQHQGPFPRSDGSVEVRTQMGPSGQTTRMLIIDGKYGWVTQQQMLDANGQVLAFAKASNHRQYQAAGVSLPHHIEITIPRAQLAMVLDVGQYTVNQLAGDPAQLWALPQLDGYELKNLAEMPPAPGPAPRVPPPESVSDLRAEAGYQPRYRGY